MATAVLSLLAAGNTIVRVLGATVVGAPLADDVHHPALLVSRAVLRLLAAHMAVSKKAEYCAQHKKDGMVNVVSKRCAHHGCTKHPSFGTAATKAEYCKEHAQDGMENVVSKSCTHQGCIKGPSYGVAGSNRPCDV